LRLSAAARKSVNRRGAPGDVNRPENLARRMVLALSWGLVPDPDARELDVKAAE
jgi:hypothetical protein